MSRAIQPDISNELKIIPYQKGVRLITPSKNDFDNDHLTIREALAFPCNVYFLNVESIILNINDHSAFSTGFNSANDAIGRSVFDVLKRDNAISITDIDKRVIRKKDIIINEDIMIRDDVMPMSYLTVKAPIYNSTARVVGVLGCSVMLGQQPLAGSLSCISKLGLLRSHKKIFSIQSYNDICTPREQQVLHLLTRGKTAKEIGSELNLSKRTIEHYIENIKGKMKVDTKSQLIEKALQ